MLTNIVLPFLRMSYCSGNGCVGVPMANVEMKLIDVSEMNYKSTDKTNGNATPRYVSLEQSNLLYIIDVMV